MSDVTPELLATAERVCSLDELVVIRLKARGYGRRRGSVILGISEETWRYRLEKGMRKVRKEQKAKVVVNDGDVTDHVSQ